MLKVYLFAMVISAMDDDQVLLKIGERAVMVGEATLVPYGEAANHVARCEKTPNLDRFSPYVNLPAYVTVTDELSSKRTVPRQVLDVARTKESKLKPSVDDGANPASSKSAGEVYAECASAIGMWFLMNEVYREFARRHPIDLGPLQIDPMEKERAIRRTAELHLLRATVGYDGVRRIDDKSEFLKRFSTNFPSANAEFLKEVAGPAFDKQLKTAPFQEMVYQCFPSMREGKLAPWHQWMAEQQLFRGHLRLVARQRRTEFYELVAADYGDMQFLMIGPATGVDEGVIRELATELITDEGELAEDGLSLVGTILDRLDSPSDVGEMNGTRSFVSQELGIAKDALKCRRLIAGRVRPIGDVILYCPMPRPKLSVGEERSIENSLFHKAHEVLVRPIVEDVLARTTVPAPFIKPAANRMHSLCARFGHSSVLFGETVPEWIKQPTEEK